MAIRLLLACLLLPALAHGQGARTLTGENARVLDGDTIVARIGKRIQKVRYIGMNAPELDHPTRGEEPGARAATEANRRLVEGRRVRLELDVEEVDSYGRLLAYVYVGDVMVNAELVAQGHAQVMTIPPNVRHQELFLRLEREARRRGLGLWSHPGRSPTGPEIPLAPPATDAPLIAQVPGSEPARSRPGVPPADAWNCPASQPIKGNFTTSSGERCIYHAPGGEFYGRTKPERCYASDEEARRDGCRRSKR